MAEDIAPGLIEVVTKEFHRLYDKSTAVQSLLKKVQQGSATYAEAQEYSLEVSRLIGQAYEKHISSAVLPDGKMHYNIASRLIPSTLDENYDLVSRYSMDVQQSLNEKAGTKLKAQAPVKDEDRVDRIVDMASNTEVYDDVADNLLCAMENYSQSIVDETLKANANFQYRAGLSPKIIRKATRKCCEWCSSLAGEYQYPENTPDDVFRRHKNCRCIVDYDPDGTGKNFQNAHTKQWQSAEERAKIEARKTSGAFTGAKKTPGWEQRHADRYYEEVRNREPYSDANKIASNVPEFSVDQIEDIRQHVFIRDQPRSDGYFRFDSDYDIAQAWQRLVEGKNIRNSDIVLLRHEHEEMTIMRQTGCVYEDAHDEANLKYNWWKTLMEEGE